MSKVITSPSTKWPGSVTIADNPNWDQIDAMEATFGNLTGEGERVFYSVIDRNQIPAIVAWVEKWELENFPNPVTAENFPRLPRTESHKLIEAIYTEMRNLYFGQAEIPNE